MAHRGSPVASAPASACSVLGVSASAYYHRATGARSARVIEDERLLERIREVHAAKSSIGRGQCTTRSDVTP